MRVHGTNETAISRRSHRRELAASWVLTKRPDFNIWSFVRGTQKARTAARSEDTCGERAARSFGGAAAVTEIIQNTVLSFLLRAHAVF